MIYAIIGGALLATVLLVVLIVWLLGRSRYDEGAAVTEAEALKEGRKARKVADEVLAEPVADESAWLDRMRDKARRS